MKKKFIPFLFLFAAATSKGLAQSFTPANNDTGFLALEKISPDDDWTRHFRIGGFAGFNIKANFSMSGNLTALGNPNGIVANGYSFNDGYVLQDDTGDAGGLTGNWGYNNASQVSGSTILMHQATLFSIGNGNSSTGGGPMPGFDLAYGDSYWYWEHAKVGWEFGFDFLPIGVSGNALVTANRNIFGFDASGIVIPPPGYQGSFDTSGENSFIGDTPITTSSGIIAGTTSEKLDVMLYTFRLGPTLYWDFNKYLGLYIGGGPAVGLVSGELSSSGVVNMADGTTANYAATKISDTKLVYGGYANATLVYHVVEDGDFYLGVQFTPMSAANFSGGGMSSHLDLGKQVYVTAGINWPF